MRLFIYLILLTVLLAGASGYFLWQTSRPTFNRNQTIFTEIARVKNTFISKTKPMFDLPLEEALQGRKSKILSNPKTALPQIASLPFAEISGLYHYTETCDPNVIPHIQSASLKKALLWHQFICRKISILPKNFFENGSPMHPSGSSYVRLAQLSKRTEFSNPPWMNMHKSEMHLLEILNTDTFKITGLKLSAWDLENMLNGEDIIIKPNHVLFASRTTGLIKSTTKYLVFPRKEWDRFITSQSITTSTKIDSSSCLAREGNICWIQNSERQIMINRIAACLLFFGFIILASGLLHTAVKRTRIQKQEAAQRLFTLQMLTHELRTPATAVRLAVETQRAEFDALPEASQKAFLQICEELQRLARVIDASKNYLKSHDKDCLFDTATQANFSANELMATILEPYLDRITYQPLSYDKNLQLDRYWVELCIKNLIENALTHGKPPVIVTLQEHENALIISVEDHGKSLFTSLEQMTIPFQKDDASHGLGLGLAIVKKVVEAMQGELIFKTEPTRFSIKLRPML